jgi:hypothetical protein
MKSSIVDVPVKVNIWIRPECQRMQFEVIKKARPSILFITSDGGRTDYEWSLILQNRKMYDTEIDWDCKIYKLYEEKNNGMYGMMLKREKLIWNTVDRCILLEDDQIPSVSYFQFCADLLEKYKDDQRVACICGMNHLGISQDVPYDYFFSRQGSIWGVATWKRVYDKFHDFSFGKDPYLMELLRHGTKHDQTLWKRIKGYADGELYEGHIAGPEFFLGFAVYGYNQLQIIPKKNLISNIGCAEDAAHSDSIKLLPRGIRRVFNMKTYELEFPLKEMEYVLPDIVYEKKRNRIIAYNHPLISLYRKMVRAILAIRYGRWLQLSRKIKKVVARTCEK